MYFSLGQADAAWPILEKAFSVREHASPAERFALEGHYWGRKGDRSKAIAAYEACLRLTPRANNVLGGLASIYGGLGEYARAAEIRKRQMEVAPFDLASYDNLMGDYIESDRFAEAKAVAEMPFPKKIDAPMIHRSLLRVAYHEGDLAAVEKEQALLVRTPYERAALLYRMSHLAIVGKFSEAAGLIPTIQDLGVRTNAPALGSQTTKDLDVSKAVAGDCQASSEGIGSLNEAEIRLACGENERVAAFAEEVLKQIGRAHV